MTRHFPELSVDSENPDVDVKPIKGVPCPFAELTGVGYERQKKAAGIAKEQREAT